MISERILLCKWQRWRINTFFSISPRFSLCVFLLAPIEFVFKTNIDLPFRWSFRFAFIANLGFNNAWRLHVELFGYSLPTLSLSSERAKTRKRLKSHFSFWAAVMSGSMRWINAKRHETVPRERRRKLKARNIAIHRAWWRRSSMTR